MRNIKRRIETFTFYDHTNIEKHLEKMAFQGWMLEKCSQYTWKYRRIEPKKIHFNVTYFPKASQYDPEPSEKQKIFIDFCEEAGWKPIASNAQMQIFANEAENPVPIETDAAVQVENIHEAMKRSYLIGQFLLLFVAVLNMLMMCHDIFRDLIYFLGNYANIFSGFCWCIVILLCGTEIFSYFSWYRKAQKAAEQDGSFIETRGHQKLHLVSIYILLIGLIGLLCSFARSKELVIMLASSLNVILLIGMVNLIRNIMKRKKVSTGINRAITIAACLILSFTMTLGITYKIFDLVQSGWLNEKTEEALEETRYSSVFLSQVNSVKGGKLSGEMQNVSYSIVTIKIPIIYDACVAGMLRKNTTGFWEELGWTYTKDNEKIWYADAVYKLYNGKDTAVSLRKYLVCWDERILEIEFDEPPTEEQIKMVAEKLK